MSAKRQSYRSSHIPLITGSEMGFTLIENKEVTTWLRGKIHSVKQSYGFVAGNLCFYGSFTAVYPLRGPDAHHCVFRIEGKSPTAFVIIHSLDGLKTIVDDYTISTGVNGIDDRRVDLILLTPPEYAELMDALGRPLLEQKDIIGAQSW